MNIDQARNAQTHKSDILVKLFPTGLIEHKYHDSYHLSSKKETGLIDPISSNRIGGIINA